MSPNGVVMPKERKLPSPSVIPMTSVVPSQEQAGVAGAGGQRLGDDTAVSAKSIIRGDG